MSILILDVIKVLTFSSFALYSIKIIRANNLSRALILVYLFISSRLLFASFHQLTFIPMFAGLSINALHSIVFSVVIFFFIPLRSFLFKSMFVFLLIILLMLMSAVINGVFIQSIVSIVKWFLLVEMTLLLLISFNENGAKKVIELIYFAFIPPVILLLLSVLLGVGKYNELDGTISYIGGFFHEAVFSVVIYTAMLLKLTLVRFGLNYKKKSSIVLMFFFILLLFVNYRTTILASLMTIVVLIYSDYWKKSVISKLSVMVATVLMALVLTFINVDSVLERFYEIPAAITTFSEISGEPDLFYKDEKKYLSGRLYIWSEYINEANGSSWVKRCIGHGMDSWKEVFPKYAHNTFVSFYYELGWLGLALLLWMFLKLFHYLFQIKVENQKPLLLGAGLTFLTLNLSTMPLWQIEGVFLLAMILSASLYWRKPNNHEN